MDEQISTVIRVLAKKITYDVNNLKADDALKFTQAVLNLAHTAQVIKQLEEKK